MNSWYDGEKYAIYVQWIPETAWYNLPGCKLLALAVYSEISHLLFAAYCDNSSVMSVNLQSAWYAFTFETFAFSLSSAYQSISRRHTEEEGENDKKNCQLIIEWGDHIWVIPILPFKITAFFVSVWVYIFSVWQSFVVVPWYIMTL